MSNCLLTNAFSPASWTECPEKIRFQIPLYQRPYAWKPEQINQLLEDLWNASYSHTQNPYYIGILSVAPTSHDHDLFDLIDGQQRITTLILIGRALMNKCTNPQQQNQWKRFLGGRLRLIGRVQDDNYLNSSDSNLAPENPNFRVAVETIGSFLEKKDVTKFSAFVFEHTRFFLSQTPDGYGVIEKNQQFVRLNNRGKQLEKHEILKVKLLARVSATEADECAKIWNICSQLGTDDEESAINETSNKPPKLTDILLGDSEPDNNKFSEMRERLYAPLLTFEEFLLIALERFFSQDQSPPEPRNQENGSDLASQSKPGNISADTAKLLTSFQADNKDIWSETKAKSFFKFMQDQNELLRVFFIQRDLQDKYKFKEKTKLNPNLNNPNVSQEQLQHLQKLKQHLIVLQSYLYVSRPAHKWMKEAFNWLTSENEKINDVSLLIQNFITKLEDIDNKDAEEKMLNNKDFSNEKGPEHGCKTPHYWFYRLDYELWEKRKDFFNEKDLKIANAFVFRRRNSVEHIDAQKNPIDPNHTVDDSFANLALITISQNSKLSNNFFKVKQELIGKTTIPSLKLLHAFTFSDWDDTAKKAHMDDMRKALSNSDGNINEKAT